MGLVKTWWQGDYADIRDHIRHHGGLDIVETLVVSTHDKHWDGHATDNRVLIDPTARNHWPLNPTLKQRRALRRDARLRRVLLARQDVVVQWRLELEARADKEREAQRKHLLAIQARQEARRAERARKRAREQATLEQATRAPREQALERAERERRIDAGIPPQLLNLLRVPAEQRSPELKAALADALERELVRRGARPFQPLDQETATWFAALDPQAARIVKHDWLVANLATLWRQHPPAPVL